MKKSSMKEKDHIAKNPIMPSMPAQHEPAMDGPMLDHMASKLMDAEEIRTNPKKMSAVAKHLGKKIKTIKSIQGLRDLRKQRTQDAESAQEDASESGEE